jgi:hypothetical protein
MMNKGEPVGLRGKLLYTTAVAAGRVAVSNAVMPWRNSEK